MSDIIRIYKYLQSFFGFNIPNYIMMPILIIVFIVLLTMFCIFAFNTISPVVNYFINKIKIKRQLNEDKKQKQLELLKLKELDLLENMITDEDRKINRIPIGFNTKHKDYGRIGNNVVTYRYNKLIDEKKVSYDKLIEDDKIKYRIGIAKLQNMTPNGF